jgi:bacteriorhodopsin
VQKRANISNSYFVLRADSLTCVCLVYRAFASCIVRFLFRSCEAFVRFSFVSFAFFVRLCLVRIVNTIRETQTNERTIHETNERTNHWSVAIYYPMTNDPGSIEVQYSIVLLIIKHIDNINYLI